MFELGQETIAIPTIGFTILGTIPYTTGRIEDRIDRTQSGARADRGAFERHVTRSTTQEQSRLTGIVGQMRTASR